MLKKIFYKNKSNKKVISYSAQRWTQDEEFDPKWELRNKVIASYINCPGIVADFGCGKMTLERYLKPHNVYLPIDFHRRDDRTIIFDVNHDPFPHINAAIAVCSGFLEYVEDIDRFVRGLETCSFKEVIISYCTTEHSPDLKIRQALNWVNHLSIFDILNLFLPTFNLSAIDDVNKNSIFVWLKK
ncbi:MAG: hypothetical protein ABSF13_08280 [Smithella sp.]|jgi:hypothetical protein